MYWRLLIVLSFLTAGASQLHAQAPPPSTVYVFPLFADGTAGGMAYRSVLKMTKTGGPASMQCTLVQRNTSAPFTGIAYGGTFYTADTLDAGFSPASQTLIILDSKVVPFEILRTNAQSPLKTGYATLTCPGTVSAQLQVSLFDAQNNKVGEATVVPATQGASFQFLVDRRDGTRLGFSLINDSAISGQQFILIARDQFNNEVDRFYDTIESWSQVSYFVDQKLRLPANFVGSVEVVGVSGGKNYAVGLQYTGTVFTTVQPLVRSTPLP